MVKVSESKSMNKNLESKNIETIKEGHICRMGELF